jgi:ABC-type thiamine transport system ATPase subunit
MQVEGITELSCGATFIRADLHVHSFGASHDVSDGTATPEAIVGEASQQGLSLIAISDHNEIANVASAIAAGEKRGVMVVPAVELSTPEGHLLCYAPTVDALERFFNRITIVGRRTSNCRCNTGMAECLNLLQNEGGFGIVAHIEIDGAFESNVPRFTPNKLDILCHSALLGFEVKHADCPIHYTRSDPDPDRRSAAQTRINRLKLGSSQFLARVLNSDAHTLNAIGRNAKNNSRITRYKMGIPSFDGLRLALQESDTRVRLEDEVPRTVPIIQGVTFEGGFLDGEAIHFSSNLTCIVGGRGSGKSTAFEAVRIIGAPADANPNSVVDSDVWPDAIGLFYKDETGALHVLSRTKDADIENVDDPVLGSTSFPVESYRQGETNTISKRVQDDPLALLTFLDQMIDLEDALKVEDRARSALNELAPKIAEARATVAKIPAAQQDLKLKQDKVERLKKERGEDFIRLQQRLESEKRTRLAITQKVSELQSAIGHEAIKIVAEGIRTTVTTGAVTLAEAEAEAIISDTEAYETSVDSVSASLKQTTEEYARKVRAQITAWSAKEAQTSQQIETKKRELLAAGIRLDIPFINKLIADEASASERLRALNAWRPHLQELLKQHRALLKQRWEARAAIARRRTAFAIKATAALKQSASDLLVTLKYEEGNLSPEGERVIIDLMGWRTLQQLKAGALMTQVGLQRLLECVGKKDMASVKVLKGPDGRPVFLPAEVDILFERLGDNDVRANLEAIAVYDTPRLTVAKRVMKAGKETFALREFKRLSLGQQQSVLLALMLTSESKAPLIVDQPEDNLDSEFIYKTIVPVIRGAKERRQVIVVTHNANIAVLGDAEQIVVLKATNDRGIIVSRGSIDEPVTREKACAILEGSREAFERRANIYGVRR